MAQPAIAYTTPDEYLLHERKARDKHEYIDGDVVAMSGASFEHNLIVFNLAGALHPQLRGKRCSAVTSDMRVAIPTRGFYTYPDIVAWCGKPEFEDEVFDTLLNPTVLIEVLSPSTEAHDRGTKFEDYRTIPSLQEYILVAQNRPHVDRFVKNEDGIWMLTDARGLNAQIDIDAINCTLRLSEIYDKVTFPEPDLEAEERGGLFRE